ncbi:DNA repair protein RAD51 homolog 2 isoform X2 [Molossus molossus]|uniref:DNA repair protein RAD51 homolog 2 isoform X2 n=1 Tax=Molossus molossus TaxID=27622 RepID=UPI001747AD02|nr:DNA repair protein RAD51 homolog 2 isoform X2 [Molossus molossus]
MGSKKLRRVGLSPELCDRLNRHQIVTCKDFLCLSPLELMKITGLSYRGVHELLCVVSRACAPQMQTAYEIKAQRSAALSPAFLSTSLSALDEALRGGVARGSITEITGPPGCGKTQFCIMMSVLATLPTDMGGMEGAVVYIDTESAFSADRLIEIAESRFPRYFNTEEKLRLTSSKVHLYRELSCDEVLQRIESLEEEIISKGVKLVIIDSVASVVRKEFDTQLQGNMRERNKLLAREAATLKYLAEEFLIPAPSIYLLVPMPIFCFSSHRSSSGTSQSPILWDMWQHPGFYLLDASSYTLCGTKSFPIENHCCRRTWWSRTAGLNVDCTQCSAIRAPPQCW